MFAMMLDEYVFKWNFLITHDLPAHFLEQLIVCMQGVRDYRFEILVTANEAVQKSNNTRSKIASTHNGTAQIKSNQEARPP